MKINLSKLNLLRVLNLERFQKNSIFLILLLIFVVLNLLVNNFSLRFDTSKGKVHTLSSSSKKILKKLDDIVTIKFFVSSNLPTRVLPVKTEVADILTEYKKKGQDKIIIKILDPKKDQSAQDEVKSLGIPELQFSSIEKDKYAVSATYFCLVIIYGDKKEIVPNATNLESLEYDLTSAIYKMTRKEPVAIGLIGASEQAGAEIQEQGDELRMVKQVLNQQFEMRYINNLTSLPDKKIDSAIKTIVVFDDGKKEYSTEEAKIIKNYLNTKGKTVFMVDGVSVNERLAAEPAKHNLFDFFEEYGLKLNKDFVLSQASEMASFSNGSMSFFTPYPFFIRTTRFDEKSSIFSSISTLFFPWVSSIEISKKTGIETKVLAVSEEKSWIQKENYALNPNNISVPDRNDLKEHNLIVEVKDKKEGQFILIPTSRFVKERFLARHEDNLGFLLNIINSYASEGALSGIRARSATIVPLQDVSEQAKDLIKYLNILLLPGLFAIYGAMRLVKRR